MAQQDRLAARVHYLQRPDIWPDNPDVVRAVETYHSWVFLTREYAFKLKKPVSRHGRDLTSVRDRLVAARAEVLLNRRLAPDVYLGYLPLVKTPSGHLGLSCCGQPVDWLVWMRRLPEDQLLDGALRRGPIGRDALRPVAEHLARFYSRAEPEGMTGPTYQRRLRDGVVENRRTLRRVADGPLADRVAALHDAQDAWIVAHPRLLDARAARVVEGHGDLRPEHVFLGSPPAIIDCLDFSRDLRLVDPAQELAFLAMTSEALGGDQVGPAFFSAYQEITADRPPPSLLAFYQSLTACTRARLAALRSQVPGQDEARQRRVARIWVQRALVRLPRFQPELVR